MHIASRTHPQRKKNKQPPIMATLTIKNLPDSLYALLKEKAAEHRRSINSEAILAVERAVVRQAAEPAEMLSALRSARDRINQVYLTESALQNARGSGRA
jgi:plasmid stability protein